MNAPIAKLFVVAMVLFAGLAGSTTWWTVVKANDLNANHADQNRRDALRGLKIRRGLIRADDNTVIARSVRDADGVYSRRYPYGSLFGHPVGYARASLSQTELEASRNGALIGRDEDGITSFFDQITGKQPEGDDIVTTLDPTAQKLATDRLEAAGASGAAVALDPRDGAVQVLASTPGYDPNAVTSGAALTRLNKDEANKPLVNRALQFGEAPGSTMKVVTATAAIDSGKLAEGSTVDGNSGQRFASVPLANDFNEDFGQVDLVTAMAKSVNTAFANVALQTGAATMRKYMRRFGFEQKPELDYPEDAMSASGEFVPDDDLGRRLIPATSRRVDLGRMGIGQDKLSVTPLQMAQVAAAVANDGKLMKPHLTDRIVDRDGRVVDKVEPEVQSTVMKPSTAAAVTEMMRAVVTRGTGTAAAIPGVDVAGKTGTAETQISQTINDVWFIAFAPAEDPRVAIAVNVQKVPGFGGEVAAPIARDIMKSLLDGSS